MDLRAIRRDLGTVASTAGFNAWDYQPDDVQDLPAAVVGGIKEIERLNRAVTRLVLGVTFFVSVAEARDAAERLDMVLSIGEADSFLTILDNVSQDDGPAWTSLRFIGSGPYIRYSMPGGESALGVELDLELTASNRSTP